SVAHLSVTTSPENATSNPMQVYHECPSVEASSHSSPKGWLGQTWQIQAISSIVMPVSRWASVNTSALNNCSRWQLMSRHSPAGISRLRRGQYQQTSPSAGIGVVMQLVP